MRQAAHLRLREVIERLRAEQDQSKRVKWGLSKPHSYRGYYQDLAFELAPDVSVAEMLRAAESALGATFHGYKGGDYVMREYTDVWLASYGCEGETLGAILFDFLLANAASTEGKESEPVEAVVVSREDLMGHIDDPVCTCFRCHPEWHTGVRCNCSHCRSLRATSGSAPNEG